MKCIWEEEDICMGQRFSRNNKTEVLIIGFRTPICESEKETEKISYPKKDQRYVSISTIDGMVSQDMTKSEYANYLTEAKYLPIEWINRQRKGY